MHERAGLDEVLWALSVMHAKLRDAKDDSAYSGGRDAQWQAPDEFSRHVPVTFSAYLLICCYLICG